MTSVPAGTHAGLFAVDLDGTLLDDRREVRDVDRSALLHLGEAGVLRVVATGRSLWSALRVMPRELPVDYLVFSSGIGIVSWPRGEQVAEHGLAPAQVADVAATLRALSCDFMLQGAAPDTHRIAYHRASREGYNVDFETRLQRYVAHAEPLGAELPPRASQFVVVHPPAGGVALWERLREQLRDVHVVRTTSPLDHASVWVEIFPADVSKAAACAWLARRHGVPVAACAAVGNDYNDCDMLEWAAASFVVGNSPADLRARHCTVASNCDGGVGESVRRWLAAARERASGGGEA